MRRPNVLIIMVDQMTCGLTGAYGHPLVRTPALDRLAAEGVRFDAAYSPCPLCAPARAAMFSGRYVSRTRSYDNASLLPSDTPTWAHHLRAAGYLTVAAGKLHFNGPDQHHGIERRLTADIFGAGMDWIGGEQDCDAPDGESFNKALNVRQAGPCDGSHQMDFDEQVHARSLEFLRSAGDGDRPFCLLTSYTHPHEPYLAPRRFWDMYEGVEIPLPALTAIEAADRPVMDRWLHGFEGLSPADAADTGLLRRLHRAYYGMVSYIDEKVGELLGALDEGGLADSTAVFFVSDHGDMLGQRRLVEKRAFYEWSARVPLIARLPGRWPAGRATAAPVSLIDLFPTLTELTGAQPPADVDGRSLMGILAGDDDGADRVAFSEYHSEAVAAPCFMARRGRFKYVYVHGHERQLFDLHADPLEQHNLSGRVEMAEVERNLHAAMLERFDPDAIAADVTLSQIERRLIRDALRQGEPVSWSFRG